MFYQVKVPVQQRNALRFLWWEDDDADKPLVQYCMTAHLFGGVWSHSVATFTLQLVAKDNLDNFSEDTIDTILKNFYVDDCRKSVSPEDKAIILASDLRVILAKGGFRLS